MLLKVLSYFNAHWFPGYGRGSMERNKYAVKGEQVLREENRHFESARDGQGEGYRVGW